jgi:hypothetical protein
MRRGGHLNETKRIFFTDEQIAAAKLKEGENRFPLFERRAFRFESRSSCSCLILLHTEAAFFMPKNRRQRKASLARPGLKLLETTWIRIGNEEYARHNRSFGLTTTRSKHVKLRRAKIRFEFRGKRADRHPMLGNMSYSGEA